MNLLLIIFVALGTIFVILMLLICTADIKSKNLNPFIGRTYAHRGLHDEINPENTLSAFDAAIKKGYGVEFDVRLTKDEIPVVFHDETLLRMFNEDVRVDSLTYDELKKYKFASTDEAIPLFSEVLDLINGSRPIIIELKTCCNYRSLCEKAFELLDNYNGSYCIESFDPRILHDISRSHPNVVRGQLACKLRKEDEKSALRRFFLSNLLLNFYSSPHFIAYSHSDMQNLCFRLASSFMHLYIAAWTIRDKAAYDQMVKKQVEMIIFENFEADRVINYEKAK